MADYCELCDLPLSQCVHGQPPPPPPEKPVRKAPTRKTATARSGSTASRSGSPTSAPKAPPRRTPQGEFRPHILAALRAHGGSADIEDVMAELAERMEGVLRPADHETVNQGELRWRYAARLERKAMLDEGLLVPPRRPGVWELSERGRTAVE